MKSLKISLFDHPFIVVVSKRENDVFIEKKLWRRLMFLLCAPLVFGTVRLRVSSTIMMVTTNVPCWWHCIFVLEMSQVS